MLTIRFAWLAKMVLLGSGQWSKDSHRRYIASLDCCTVTPINHRIMLDCVANRDIVELFPAGKPALDPSRVLGLVAPTSFRKD